jgi:O-antigen/teichoic acid export membrane protein
MRKLTVAALLAVAILLARAAPAAAESPLHVYYAGPSGAVPTALELAGFDLVDQPSGAQVLVLNGTVPDQAAIAARVSEGAGVVLLLGPALGPLEVQAVLGLPLELTYHDQPLSLMPVRGIPDPLLSGIVWTGAPQVRERYSYATPRSDLVPLVTGFETGEHVLAVHEHGQHTDYVFTPFLGEYNSQLQDWAYFKYFIYHVTARAAGRQPLAFADYPGAPVPHARERTILYAGLAVMLALAVTAYWLVRRYSLAHPEALDKLVANREVYAAREAGTDWEEVGFHRPLGGFLLALMLGLVMFIPLIIYQNLILPVYILPSAQALGIWGRVVQFFTLIWNLFDVGTSTAFIKYLSEHRVRDPKRGILYGQVFVWWQALSGAVQVALFVLIGGTILPRTAYALYAWSVIVHTFIQIPGFYELFRHALTGWQRFDYAQILDTGLYVLAPMITQPVIVTLFVMWGRNNPVLGMTTSGLIGLGLAAYATQVLSFVVGIWLYRRLGHNAGLLFMAHFDWATIKSSFRFGVFEMLGSVAWSVGQAVEILITQGRLVNYAEVWGNWGLAQNFIFAYQVLQTLYSNLMPSISESISHAHRKLSQYYAAVAYKWGGIVSAFVGAVLLAVADRFILGASGPEFVRAAAYAGPLVIWGAIQYPSWVGDNVQLAANKPYLKSILVAAEQLIRIVFAFLLLERFQINALIIAYFIGLLGKDIVAYFVNGRLCFPQRFYFWQSLGAPLLAGLAHYAVLRWVGGLIWQREQITSVLIFFIGILPSFPLFAFFYGLFGGWDDDTLAELRRAVDLSGMMRPLAWLFWRATALGAHLSPLHGRFPIDIRAAAVEEAKGLTAERVRL